MTVVLRIRRVSGRTDVHELPAEGDYVVVPPELLRSDDVLGFDVEIPGPEPGEAARPFGARAIGREGDSSS